jgi:hypothetical protein
VICQAKNSLTSLAWLTLPLSGRQGAQGGAEESLRGPVHSRGLLDVIIRGRQID